jgi:energy-coupling factor transport system ATP-binding protein
MPVIETNNLTYVYSPGTPFEKTAMKDVSLTVEEGDFIGVIGHTGSGKSTLVQHLNGLLRPTSGTVLLDGKDIWAEPKKIREVRFQVGMVFQYPEHQLFEDTVYKDIAFGPKNMGLSEEEIGQRVRKAAQAVGLREELLEKSPFDLSGGEKRRAAIAGVMAMEPKVLILDEPTAGLDPKGRDLILEQIRRYKEENHTTVLLVSHSMEDVARVAKKVLVMNGGQVAMLAPTEEVFSRAEELTAMGLSIPAVTKVFMGLREKGYPVGGNVYTVDQAVERLKPLLGGHAHRSAKGGEA